VRRLPVASALLVLASASPRRRELLALLGIPFQVRPSEAPESALAGELPSKMVVRLSLEKARRAASEGPGRYFLGSDTSVSLTEGGRWRVFGKPMDRDDARRMLLALGGREHLVHTGFALLDSRSRRVVRGCQESVVKLRELGSEEMEAYLDSGIADDKAGAYAVQDQRFQLVQSIDGCVSSVMGLPLGPVRAALLKMGLAVADTEAVSSGCGRLTGVPCCLCSSDRWPGLKEYGEEIY